MFLNKINFLCISYPCVFQNIKSCTDLSSNQMNKYKKKIQCTMLFKIIMCVFATLSFHSDQFMVVYLSSVSVLGEELLPAKHRANNVKGNEVSV